MLHRGTRITAEGGRLDRRWRAGSAGFTLMELMVVIAVLSLVVLIVVPRLPSTDAGALRTSARTLAATLRYLQDHAITGKTPYRLHLRPGSGELTVTRLLQSGEDAPPDDPFLGRRPLSGAVTVADITTQLGGKEGSGEVVLPFGPAGLEEFAIIHLQGANEQYFTIFAYPGGGKVEVFPGYREEAP